MRRGRPFVILGALVVLAAGLTGCAGSRLDRQVEWLQSLDGIEFAEVVAEDLDSSALTGTVRGELVEGISLERAQELARLVLDYEAEHGGSLRLGRGLLDFEIHGEAVTPASVERWWGILGTPRLLSGLVGFTGTHVRVLRSDAGEVMEGFRDFPGSLYIETFGTREESEADRRADDAPVSDPSRAPAGPVFVLAAGCAPSDDDWERARLVAADLDIVDGTFDICEPETPQRVTRIPA